MEGKMWTCDKFINLFNTSTSVQSINAASFNKGVDGPTIFVDSQDPEKAGVYPFAEAAEFEKAVAGLTENINRIHGSAVRKVSSIGLVVKLRTQRRPVPTRFDDEVADQEGEGRNTPAVNTNTTPAPVALSAGEAVVLGPGENPLNYTVAVGVDRAWFARGVSENRASRASSLISLGIVHAINQADPTANLACPPPPGLVVAVTATRHTSEDAVYLDTHVRVSRDYIRNVDAVIQAMLPDLQAQLRSVLDQENSSVPF